MKVLALIGETLLFNSSFDQSVIEQAYADDPVAASAEYGAQFRSDLENYISREAIQSVTVLGRHELPYVPECKYHAFVDPSGGSRDSFTLAISHAQSGIAILDCLREIIPPFNPELACKSLCEALKAYKVGAVKGDRYAGEWPSSMFRKFGVEYIVSDKDKSTLYAEFLPLCNSGKVELLEHHKMLAQLQGLERSVRSGSKERIDHSPNGRDDLINSAAGSLLLSAEESANDVSWIQTKRKYHGIRRPFASHSPVVHTEQGLQKVFGMNRTRIGNLSLRIKH